MRRRAGPGQPPARRTTPTSTTKEDRLEFTWPPRRRRDPPSRRGGNAPTALAGRAQLRLLRPRPDPAGRPGPAPHPAPPGRPPAYAAALLREASRMTATWGPTNPPAGWGVGRGA